MHPNTDQDTEYILQLSEEFDSKLFDYEKKILQEGLKILGISFTECFTVSLPILTNGTIDFSSLSQNNKMQSIIRKAAEITIEEEEALHDFYKLNMKLTFILINFYEKKFDKNAALWYSKFITENIENAKKRCSGDYDIEETNEYISNLKGEILRLEENIPVVTNSIQKLIWSSSKICLQNISETLWNDGYTNSKNSFAAVFEKGEVCKLKKGIDVVVVLIYKFINHDPGVIKSSSNSRKARIALANNFFSDNSGKIARSISFKDRMHRFRTKDVNYKQINDLCDKYIKLIS